jgi:hypothetical protein
MPSQNIKSNFTSQMIIYGTNSTKIATETVADKCLNCEKQFSIEMNVFQRYVHVFWIPFFPAGKIAVSQCTTCQQVLEKKDFTYSLTEGYEKLKSDSRTPIWTFSGLALIAAIIVWGVIANKQNDARNAKIILAPQKNDVYEIKLGEKKYTLYKVDQVVGDSVFLLMNKYEVNQASGVSDLEAKGYDTEILPLTKEDLKAMLKTGEIMDIERK